MTESAAAPTATPSGSARLWLVRHAQASFGSDDYDRLSERGEQQAVRFARWLAADPDLEAFAEKWNGGGNPRAELGV